MDCIGLPRLLAVAVERVETVQIRRTKKVAMIYWRIDTPL